MTSVLPEPVVSPATQRALTRVVRLAQRIFDVPMALFSVVGERGVTFQAAVGLPDGFTGLPLEQSFCRVAVSSRDTLVVPDAAQDPRFAELDVVRGEPHVRFYAAHPLRPGPGLPPATLSVLDVHPRELTGRQIQALADLASWVEAELERDLDLREAGDIQRGLLPPGAPQRDGYEFAGLCLPARDIGGDFYDYYQHDGVIQSMIVDVMGRGIPAAILAATVRASLRAAYRHHDGLAAMVERSADSLLSDLTRTGSFVTLFVARLEPDGALEYVDAGHGLAWVLGRDGQELRRLTSAGLPMGVGEHAVWNSRRIDLAPGETLLAASDGVLHLFGGRDRTQYALLRMFADAADLGEATESLRARAADTSITDDVSFIAIRRDR